MKYPYLFVFFIIFTNISNSQRCNYLLNRGFDSLNVAGTTVGMVTGTQMPVWQTTATDGKFEVWANGYNGINSFSGIQFIEMNATMPSTIFQTITAVPGTTLSISFAHRGRGGIDSISVSAGPIGGPYSVLGKVGDSQSAWGTYTLNYVVPNLGNFYSIRFNSIYWALGNPAIGNWLDAVKICGSAEPTTNITSHALNDEISIFPNPSNSTTVINLNENKNDFQSLSIYNVLGKEIINYSISNGESIKINKSDVGCGLFTYQLKGKSKNISGKFIFTE